VAEVFDIEADVAPGSATFLTRPLAKADGLAYTSGPAGPTLRPGNFRIMVIDPRTAQYEVMYVTSGADTNIWRVRRAQSRTKAKDFPRNSIIRHVINQDTIPPPPPSVIQTPAPPPNTTLQFRSVENNYHGLQQGVETRVEVNLPGRSCQLFSVYANKACRFRIYASNIQREADIGREQVHSPGVNAGCLLELVYIQSIVGTLVLSPTVDVVSQDVYHGRSFPAVVRIDDNTTHVRIKINGYVYAK
jgi:hypothetical protein